MRDVFIKVEFVFVPHCKGYVRIPVTSCLWNAAVAIETRHIPPSGVAEILRHIALTFACDIIRRGFNPGVCSTFETTRWIAAIRYKSKCNDT